MEVSNISSSLGADSSETTSKIQQKTLNGDDFLKLLTVQLSNQNPMEPMKDLDFISQMSSFSALEQMKSLRDSFDQYIGQQQSLSAQNYLGKEVTIKNENNQQIIGTVSSVSTAEDGTVNVTVNNQPYDINLIREVRNQA